MGHYLQALIVPVSGAERLKELSAPVHPVLITPALLLLPVSDELYDYVVQGDDAADLYAGVFWKFHPALRAFGASIANDEPFGYLETDYFGGDGLQAAGAWRSSETLVAPRRAEAGPINEVLRALGVARSRQFDEFETAGLSRHRSTEDWLEEPRFGGPAERTVQHSVRRPRRLAFDRPPAPFETIMLDLLGQAAAQVHGIREAYVVRCSIDGNAAENVVAVAVDDDLASEQVMSELLPKVRLLLGAHEHLDVLPFHVSDLPAEVRRNGYAVRFAQPQRQPWWKIWP